MRLDSLVRLIEAADFMSFREIAIRTLAARGFAEVELSDGWSDGGTDVRLFQRPGVLSPLAVQVTVDKRWEAKIAADARKVRDKLQLSDLLVVTSYRLAEVPFTDLADRVRDETGVRLQKMDSQGIATHALERGNVNDVLRTLGIQIPLHREPQRNLPDLRQDVAYAFSFFDTETDRFRQAVIEEAVTAVLFEADANGARDATTDKVAATVGLSATQKRLVSSAIDRMLQRGQLTIGEHRSLQLSADTSAKHEAMLLVREVDWRDLRTQVGGILLESTAKSSVALPAIEDVLGALGALVLSAGEMTAEALSSRVPHSVLREQIRDRLRGLNATLDGQAFPDGAARDELLERLVATATGSSLGRHLVAGEVFLALASMQTPQLVKSLVGSRDLVVMVDSSVSIPVLAGLMYEPAGRHFSVAARHAYDQLREHEIEIHLPTDYLEETAAHLADAYRYYAGIVAVDSDLDSSTNAFVSHYAALRRAGRIVKDFEEYLKGFGFNARLLDGDYFRALEVFQRKLREHFERYGIRSVQLREPSRKSIERAKEAIAIIQYDSQFGRRPVLIRHDQKTIGFLMDADARGEGAFVLCTWDTLHFKIREREEANDPSWHVLDPAFLGDTLALAAPANAPKVRVLSPLTVAMEMTDETAKAGSRIWDAIVSVEKANLHDADLVIKAKEFKSEFLGKVNSDTAFFEIKEAWLRWKREHQIELFDGQGKDGT